MAVESLCLIGKYLSAAKFSVVSVDYFRDCKDCICNWWGTEDFWRTSTTVKFGLPVELPVPAPVPAFSNYRKEMKEVQGYPVSFDRTESPNVTLSQQCKGTLTCETWEEPSWEGATTIRTYPCDYLIFDVCYGSYSCECSNGYSMTTDAMPKKGKNNLSKSESVFDVELPDDLDSFPDDSELLKLVAFAAGVLLIICTIPCICCVCCYCRKSKDSRIGCLDSRRRDKDQQQ